MYVTQRLKTFVHYNISAGMTGVGTGDSEEGTDSGDREEGRHRGTAWETGKMAGTARGTGAAGQLRDFYLHE